MCGGSSTSNQTSSTRSVVNRYMTKTATRNVDKRRFADNRRFTSNVRNTDKSQDRRAVLNNAMQIMDGIYYNVDPSDEVMKSLVNSWERQTKQLFTARRFDTLAATRLLDQIMQHANQGTIALTEQQQSQIESWQNQLEAGADFAKATLDTGARLIESAGERQQTVSDKVLELAGVAMGGASSGTVRLVAVSLLGAAFIAFASKRGRA